MEDYLATIKLFAGNFAPKGWMYCWGQTLPINQYTALFSLLGTTYGGDGRTNFKLPDLRGRVPVGAGDATVVTQAHALGEEFGLPTHSLTPANLPISTVLTKGKLSDADTSIALPAQSLPTPFDTYPPSLGLNYIICIEGYYPPRD